VSFQKRTVARYAVELNLEFWLKDFPWLFFFTDDTTYLGATLSHIDYNYRADPIVMDAEWGAGIKVLGVQLRANYGQSVSLGNKFIAEPKLWNSFSVRVPFEF